MTEIKSEEQFKEQKQFLLQKIDEVIKGLNKIKLLIEDEKACENEDWVASAKPLHGLINPFYRYQDYIRKNKIKEERE